MNLFRSEEHIKQWLGTRDPGMTISVTKLWKFVSGAVAEAVEGTLVKHTIETDRSSGCLSGHD